MKKTITIEVPKNRPGLARALYLRDGGHDGRYRHRVVPDKRKAAQRKACRRGKWGGIR